jgi:hypothetical protein
MVYFRMKELRFAFDVENLRVCAEYLRQVRYSPFFRKNVRDVVEQLKAASVKKFETTFGSSRETNLSRLPWGAVYSSVPWKGFSCFYFPCSFTSSQTELRACDVQETFPDHSIIEVGYLIYHRGETVVQVLDIVPLHACATKLDQALNETDKQRKGELLEDCVAGLFEAVGAFKVVERRCRTETEEIDLVVENCGAPGVWTKEAPFIVCECKNWWSPVPRKELDSLVTKCSNRRGRCSVGIFISMHGTTDDFDQELLRLSRGNLLIIVLTQQDLKDACQRGLIAVLNEAHRREVMR